MIRIEPGPHLDDESRAMLASGRANAAVALFIETLIEMRGLQDVLGEAAAGLMLESETPAGMSPGALERALAAIDAGKNQSGRAAPSRASRPAYDELRRLPIRLMETIAEAEAGRGWGPLLLGPIRQLPLFKAGEVNAEILRIPPGVATARHTHGGQEYTLCLSGNYSDATGSYGPGDVSVADPSVTHRPVADNNGGPVFVLMITDAGLKLVGVMGVLQRLIGK